MKGTLILALAGILLLSVFAHAADASSLPSRKAAVVLPLLRQFSAKDNYARVTQILGKEDSDIGAAYRDCVFRLDDSTYIAVKASLDGKKVYFVHHDNDVLFEVPITSR